MRSTITWVLFSCSIVAHAQWSQRYDEFKEAFNRNDLVSLRMQGDKLMRMADPESRALGQLCLAAVCYRTDDMACCLTHLADDSFREVRTDQALSAQAAKFKAMVSNWRGDPRMAERTCTDGIRGLDTLLFAEEYCDLLITMAEAQRDGGRPGAAINSLDQALRIADAKGYAKGQGLVQLNIGNLRFDQGRYSEAHRCYADALIIASKHGLTTLAMNAVSNMGSAAIMMNDHSAADRILDSLILSLSNSNSELRARMLSQRGFSASLRGDQPRAIEDLLSALEVQRAIRDSSGVIRSLQYLAIAEWESGAWVRAIAIMNECIMHAKTKQLPQIELEAHSYLAWWHETIGDLDQCIAHKNAEMTISDSLHKARFKTSTAASEIALFTAEKERRIAEQEQALALAAAEDRRKSIQRNALIGATALLVAIALLLYRSMRNRQRLARKEKELHNKQVDQLLAQQELKSINAMLEGQENERDRMGRDLHDRLGSMLGGIKANMAALEDRVEAMRQDQQYQKVNRLLDQTVSELRQISHDMAAATLNRFGLEKALKDLRDTLHINGRLHVELNTFGLDQRLERSVEIALYRIVQELVSNVLKHAKASELTIGVTRAPGRLSVVVSDNGVGFDAAQPNDGMGLSNVRSRATALGASVQVDSTPGKGTTVSVECPVVE